MIKLLRSLLLVGSVLLVRPAAGQMVGQPVSETCGTPSVEAQLTDRPELRERVEAIEAQTQRYIKEAGGAANKPIPGTPAPLLVIPVVVHVVYSAANQNLSDASFSPRLTS